MAADRESGTTEADTAEESTGEHLPRGAGRPDERAARPREDAEGSTTPVAAPPRENGASPADLRRRRTLDIRRPLDGTAMGEVPITHPREVLEAVDAARGVQRDWIELEAEQRFSRLGGLVREVADRQEELVDVIHEETGKPRIEALVEVLLAVDLLKHYMEVAPPMLRRQWVRTDWLIGKSAFTYREPYGVIGAITPWNYPFLLPMDAVAAALFTGNAIVLKPSEHTPHTSLAIRAIVRDAGLPDDLVQVLPGDGETGEALVEAGVDKIVFTGSSKTGRTVMRKAAESLTPVALELGGKDPAIVLDDADLDRAAKGVVYGGFFNAGQTCLSTERVFVHEAVYDEFLERVVGLVGKLRVPGGDGPDGEYDVGPMTTAAQLEVVEDQLEDALSRGARIAVGGERATEGSNVFLPTVVVDVDQTMRLVWEETFGPVLPIMKIADETEALRVVNASPYGLFASVWTEDRERGERLGESLRCGGVSINDTLSHYAVPGLPMGGVGESGFGRRRGSAGLEEMTRARSVLVHRTGLGREIWWYPYTRKSYRLVRALLEYRQSSGVARFWNGIKGLFRRLGGTH